MSVSIPATNEPQPDDTRDSMVSTHLGTFGFISTVYGFVVIVAGLTLRSVSYVKYLLAYWAITTITSSLCVLLGSLSAQGQGIFVRPSRVGLGFLTLMQGTGAVAVLPKELRMCMVLMFCYIWY